MMNKHTPGPWSIGPYGEVIGASGEKVVLAGGFSVGSTYERPERQSNLVLAVAAPELLEALEGMLEVYGGEHDADGLPKHEVELNLIAYARAAIEAAGLRIKP